MKYSIIGELVGITKDSVDEQTVLDKLNSYNPIWRMVPSVRERRKEGTDEAVSVMTFEIWLATTEDRDVCFADMKSFVDVYKGRTSWHECTHDEVESRPCKIVEEYIQAADI
jgi:hypothetical protein